MENTDIIGNLFIHADSSPTDVFRAEKIDAKKGVLMVLVARYNGEVTKKRIWIGTSEPTRLAQIGWKQVSLDDIIAEQHRVLMLCRDALGNHE